MPRHYLLDTNIISYLTDPHSPYRESIKRHLFALDDRDDLSVSVVTLYELSYVAKVAKVAKGSGERNRTNHSS